MRLSPTFAYYDGMREYEIVSAEWLVIVKSDMLTGCTDLACTNHIFYFLSHREALVPFNLSRIRLYIVSV